MSEPFKKTTIPDSVNGNMSLDKHITSPNPHPNLSGSGSGGSSGGGNSGGGSGSNASALIASHNSDQNAHSALKTQILNKADKVHRHTISDISNISVIQNKINENADNIVELGERVNKAFGNTLEVIDANVEAYKVATDESPSRKNLDNYTESGTNASIVNLKNIEGGWDIAGYYNASKFYSDSNHITEISAKNGYIYKDLDTGDLYSCTSGSYTRVSQCISGHYVAPNRFNNTSNAQITPNSYNTYKDTDTGDIYKWNGTFFRKDNTDYVLNTPNGEDGILRVYEQHCDEYINATGKVESNTKLRNAFVLNESSDYLEDDDNFSGNNNDATSGKIESALENSEGFSMYRNKINIQLEKEADETGSNISNRTFKLFLYCKENVSVNFASVNRLETTIPSNPEIGVFYRIYSGGEYIFKYSNDGNTLRDFVTDGANDVTITDVVLKDIIRVRCFTATVSVVGSGSNRVITWVYSNDNSGHTASLGYAITAGAIFNDFHRCTRKCCVHQEYLEESGNLYTRNLYIDLKKSKEDVAINLVSSNFHTVLNDQDMPEMIGDFTFNVNSFFEKVYESGTVSGSTVTNPIVWKPQN